MLIVKISCVFFLCLSLLFYLSDNWAIDPFWFSPSYSYILVKKTQPSFKRRLVHWIASLILPLVRWGLQRLEPLIITGDWNLQPPIEVWQDPLVKEYEEIFKSIDFSVLPVPKRGPKMAGGATVANDDHFVAHQRCLHGLNR